MFTNSQSSQKPTRERAAAPSAPDTPCMQPYFTFSQERKLWVTSEGAVAAKAPNNPQCDALDPSPPTLTVLTWNIDFMRYFPNERMSAALSHLETYLTSSITPKNAVVILFQEMVASDLCLIQSTPWIRERFYLTDSIPQNWATGHYGTCTLVDRRLPLKQVFRVHYHSSRMGRDALFVDICLPSCESSRKEHGASTADSEQPSFSGATLRITNTHLESLPSDLPLRPSQLSTAAQYMHDPTLHAAVLAGDLNAIEPFDRSLHTANKLKDAYLEMGGQEDSEDGYTWGQMAGRESREKFGCCRMDKVLYVGGLEVKRLERFRMGVEVKGGKARELWMLAGGLDGGWVTDRAQSHDSMTR